MGALVVVIGVFRVPGVDAEVRGKENPVTGVAVGVIPVEVKVSKLRLGMTLEGVSIDTPCPDILLFCCCCTMATLARPREAGRRKGCTAVVTTVFAALVKVIVFASTLTI